MEEQKEEKMYFACCPHCRHILMQGVNGTNCCIKCTQCGRIINIVIKEDTVMTKEKE